MLVSLSKLVSKSTSFISEQVDLLLSCLSQENTWQLRVTALRCLHLIFVKEGCCSPVNIHIFLYTLPNLPSSEMLEFAQLLASLENASQSPIMSKSLATLRVLTDVSTKLWAITESKFFSVCSSPLSSRVISLIMARLSSPVKPLPDPCQTNSRIFQEVKSLLNLILRVVGEHRDLGVMVLGEISSFIEYFANLHENFVAIRQIGSSEILDFEGKMHNLQRWFLALRAKFIGTAEEILEVLDTSKEEHFNNIIEVQNGALVNLKCLQKFTQFPFRLKRLAKELDLISSSFIGMDCESSKIIATLALSCSLLAFTAGFPLFFPNIPGYKILRTFDREDSAEFFKLNATARFAWAFIAH
ncbi:hypothetical protein CRYUN_Cryun10bG0171300 [Craigia yunnanensis]